MSSFERWRLVLTSLVAAASAASCASGARGVAPVAIPASDYAAMDCRETRLALGEARLRQVQLERSQNSAALLDTVGVLMTLVPIGSATGGNVAGDLAQAKGEVRALRRALEINCRAELHSNGGEEPQQEPLPPSQETLGGHFFW